MKRQYKVGYITSNGDKYLDDVKQALVEKGLANDDTPDSELDDIIVNLSQGGGSVEVPPVTDLAVDENYILTFTEPDVSGLIEQGATITYLVTINETTIEVDTNSINISPYLVSGENIISVIVKAILSSDEVITSVEQSAVFSETITTLETTMPEARYNMCVATFGDNTYIFGAAKEFDTWKDDILKFDKVNETITTISSTFPAGFNSASATVIGTNAYIFGGEGYATNYLKTICKFDSLSETVTTLSTTLPKTLYYLSAGINEKNVYLFGGSDGTNYPKTIYKFDSVNEAISLIDTALPTAPKYYPFAVANYKDVIYLFGGNGKTDKYIYKFY